MLSRRLLRRREPRSRSLRPRWRWRCVAMTGSLVPGKQKIGGGPSVLYDAVLCCLRKSCVKLLVANPAARDFVADAFAHLKFIAYVDAALPLFEKAGIRADMDDGCINLTASKRTGAKGAAAFVITCRNLRHLGATGSSEPRRNWIRIHFVAESGRNGDELVGISCTPRLTMRASNLKFGFVPGL